MRLALCVAFFIFARCFHHDRLAFLIPATAARLPEYDFIYLGDNAPAPYGTRSFESVYRYTLECVEWFFRMNCLLVILAWDTTSAKALRCIQKHPWNEKYNDKMTEFLAKEYPRKYEIATVEDIKRNAKYQYTFWYKTCVWSLRK